MMIFTAIIDSTTGAFEGAVADLAGSDLAGRETVPVPAGWDPDPLVSAWEWDAVARVWVPASLDPLKAAAMDRIDMMAGEARAAIGSRGYGQEMTYVIKAGRARACLADPAPDPAAYPMLAAEIGITGATLGEVAAAIVSLADQWELAAAMIEAVRLGAKQQVAAADSRASIEAIKAGIVWPPVSPEGMADD